MDHLLKKFGFLEFSASNVVFGPMQWGPVRKVARKAYDFLGLHGKVSLPQSVNWSKTKAFTTIRSTGEGVSINLAGREPDGIVDPADFEKVRDQVMDALSSFVDPKTGRKPVKAIYRREEIFKGKHADTAPDILMEPAEQYSLTHAKSALEDADWISGDHRLEGVIVAAGPNVKPFEQPPMLVDMAPTILAALDAPASIEHTGRVLHEVVGSDAKVSQAEAKPAVQIPGMPTGAEELDRQRHRGRRDGGAPPRSRLPRVAGGHDLSEAARSRFRYRRLSGVLGLSYSVLRSRTRWTPPSGPRSGSSPRRHSGRSSTWVRGSMRLHPGWTPGSTGWTRGSITSRTLRRARVAPRRSPGSPTTPCGLRSVTGPR